MSIASEKSVASQISILESAAPAAAEAAAMATTTSQYSITPTPQRTPSPSNNQAEQSVPSTSSPTSYNDYLTVSAKVSPTTSSTTTPLVISGTISDTNGGWGAMEHGTHIGVIVSIIIGIIFIVFFSFWFCCGGRAWWSKHHGSHRTDAGELPLYAVRGGRNTQAGVNRAEDGIDAPPTYAEVAPPEHQTVAGGMRNEVERQEEEAVVSDGKTPLSEIPFEDVVLERNPSESESSSSASRDFEQRHHGMGGDTRGHTNT